MVDLARHQLEIDAPAATVFRLLTTADGLTRWMGISAVADATPGGTLTWTHENGATMVGHFIEIDPPRRLVIAYGWQDDLMGVPPASTTVEIDLRERAGRTTLSLIHHSLPPEVVREHEHGWRHFLGELAAVAGRD